MESPAELKKEFEEFSKDTDALDKIRNAWERHKEFLRLYPFRRNPTKIDELTPERIYNPGGEYFFYWIEHGLKDIGRIGVGSAVVWKNAKNSPDKLKRLLRILVDDTKDIANKIDAPWEDIPRFGGEKQIAKKILFCYYPGEVVPIFSKAHLEHFCTKLGLDYKTRVRSAFGKEYDDLAKEGKKFQSFNELLLEFKNGIKWLSSLDNASYMRFLYHAFPPPDTTYGTFGGPKQVVPDRIRRIILDKFKNDRLTQEQTLELTRGEADEYERLLQGVLEKNVGVTPHPTYESAVVFLFGKFHHELGFPLVTNIQVGFPDATAIDEEGKEVRIEFKLYASQFNYPSDECDYVVCWRNDLSEEDMKKLPKIIALEEFIIERFV